jgi:hypothetical protein
MESFWNRAEILAYAAAPTVGVGGINPWRLGGALPRRGFPRKISKIQTKSPMHKKCSKSFSRPRFGGRAAMHTEMAPTSSRAQGKGEPNVAASVAKCVTGTGTRSFTAAIGGTADMNGRVASANSVEFDPQRSWAGLKSRSAAVSCHRGVLSFRSEVPEAPTALRLDS